MGERVTFASNGEQCEGYLAVPSGGSGPGVVVIQEWWGLVGHVTALADRFAAAGYVALAPDLYHGEVASEPDEARKLLMALEMDRAGKDIAGAAHYLDGRPEQHGGVGVVGFCMGGSLALWSATLSGEITAAVGFYPPLDWSSMGPRWAEYAGKAALIHTAESDGGSDAVGIGTAVAAITAAGGQVEVYDYPGTHHAFFNDERPEVYDATAAELAWERTLDLFGRRLRTPV